MRDKTGFTLAEVLVTLGVIGFVATLTIPNAMKNWQAYTYKQGAKEAYSKSSQIIQQIKIDNGGEWPYSYLDNKFSSATFRSYFKSSKLCHHNGSLECGVPQASPSDVYKYLTGVGANTYSMDDGQFITNDGIFYGINNDVNGDFITVDVNGYYKKPNVFGEDVFIFQVQNGVLIPMGAENSKWPAASYCIRTGADAYQGFGCMYYVMQGTDY